MQVQKALQERLGLTKNKARVESLEPPRVIVAGTLIPQSRLELRLDGRDLAVVAVGRDTGPPPRVAGCDADLSTHLVGVATRHLHDPPVVRNMMIVRTWMSSFPQIVTKKLACVREDDLQLARDVRHQDTSRTLADMFEKFADAMYAAQLARKQN